MSLICLINLSLRNTIMFKKIALFATGAAVGAAATAAVYHFVVKAAEVVVENTVG